MSKIRAYISGLYRGKKGFTLIELLLVVAITGVLAGAIAMTIMQITDTVATSRNTLTANNWARNAQNWIQTDIKMAQNVKLGTPSGLPLTLNWTAWGGSQVEVNYFIDSNDSLKRTQSVDGVPRTETLIAKYVAGTAAATNVRTGTGIYKGNTIFELTIQLSANARDEAINNRSIVIHQRVLEPDVI